MPSSAFSGSIVAIITPFKGNNVDFPALKKLIDWQIAQGIQAIVPCGTTGESATFTHDEQHRVVAETCPSSLALVLIPPVKQLV
jgi:4-hydroxy-tetrahydrodipicolinate synthase